MQKKQDTYSVIWFTNNLRTQDNTVLSKALQSPSPLLAIYCFDPRHYATTPLGFKKTERYRAQFTIESVVDLKHQLQDLNIPLFVFHKTPEEAITEFCQVHHITDIFCQKTFTQEELDVVKRLRLKLPNAIAIQESYDQFLYHPHDVKQHLNIIPKVFTDFRKTVEKNCSVNPITSVNKQKALGLTNNTSIPKLTDLGLSNFERHPHSAFPFSGGETAAYNRLNDYVFKTQKVAVYKKTRNGLVGTDYSSKLSAWLANGCISARQIYWTVKEFEKTHIKNQSTYWLIFELIWRDFFKYIALQHGNRIFQLHGINQQSYNWHTNKQALASWCNGTTSEPFVNANMIELNKTGWMSNRGRQNVGSYFAKTQQLDWRMGAAYFESLLIDYDVHSNYGNWQYVAGVGNDPRNRTFNVKRQAERYDKNHKFQKRWLQTSVFE